MIHIHNCHPIIIFQVFSENENLHPPLLCSFRLHLCLCPQEQENVTTTITITIMFTSTYTIITTITINIVMFLKTGTT